MVINSKGANVYCKYSHDISCGHCIHVVITFSPVCCLICTDYVKPSEAAKLRLFVCLYHINIPVQHMQAI